MKLEDIDEVFNLEKEIFSIPWKKEDFLYELKENPYANYFVLKINNKIIGYVGLWIIFETSQITNICISNDYRKLGYGKLLLEKAVEIAELNKCENISLEVRVSNINAISLYEKYGFIKANIRKSYYSDNNEDAYLMIKPLGGNL